MSKTIFFSPIGGNDPVSSATEHDGSMLHICRWYKPDVVYLYLSKEMVERENLDHRYTYCLAKLGELIGKEYIVDTNVFLIEKNDLTEVQDYDFYYEEFQQILERIKKENDIDDRLLVNIASGTPAMKSELLITSVMNDYDVQPIQVVTPNRDINVHHGKDEGYDPEMYWEYNRDNCEGAENRCIEVNCPNLSVYMKKNLIAKHVQAYDYSAALSLADDIRGSISNEAYDMLRLAVARIKLDLATVDKIKDENKFNFLPQMRNDHRMIYEYLLTMIIKIKREEYGDFVRAISPVLTDLFDQIVRKNGVDIRNYCVKKDSVLRWSINKLQKDEVGIKILDAFSVKFKNFNDYTIVSALNLLTVITVFVRDDSIKKNAEELRNIEEKLRNVAAHEIVSISEEKLSEIVGKKITFDYVFKLLKTCSSFAGVVVKDWNSYDTMNEAIIAKLQ